MNNANIVNEIYPFVELKQGKNFLRVFVLSAVVTFALATMFTIAR